MSNAFAEIVKLLQGCTKDPILNSPASMADILAAESLIGKELPDDVRVAYLLGDGEAEIDDEFLDVNGEPFSFNKPLIFSGFEFISIRQVVKEYLGYRELMDDWDLEDNINDWVDIVPVGTVKNYNFSPKWVPIAKDNASYIAVDYDPGPKGVKGQVILFGHDCGTYLQLGTSFEQFCEFLLERYQEKRMHHWFLPPEQIENYMGLEDLFLREHGVVRKYMDDDIVEMNKALDDLFLRKPEVVRKYASEATINWLEESSDLRAWESGVTRKYTDDDVINMFKESGKFKYRWHQWWRVLTAFFDRALIFLQRVWSSGKSP